MEKKGVKVEIGNRNLQLQDQPEPAGLSFEVSCRRNSTSTTTLLCRRLLFMYQG